MKPILISITCLLFFNLNSTALETDSLINKIFFLSYNQEYYLADSILQNNKDNIDEIYFAVLDIDMSYWKNVTGTNNPKFQVFESTLHKYRTENPVIFQKKVIELIALSYQLRYERKRYKLFSAIATHKKTKHIYNEISTNEQKGNFDEEELYQLYNAMFLYFNNYINPFADKTKKANSHKALTKMVGLTKSGNTIVKTLACYFVGKTYLKYEKTPEKGIPYFQYLCKKYPGNIKFPEFLNECKSQIDN